MDGCETTMERLDDFEELFVFGAGDDLGSQGNEQGNLEVDLVVISTVEDAIEFGAFEGEIEVGDESFFLFADFAGEFQVFALSTFVAVVFFELISSTREDGLQGRTDSAKAGRFERFVISPESGVDLVGTEIELFGGIADFAIEVAE